MKLSDQIVRWRLPVIGLELERLKFDQLHGGLSSLLGHDGRQWSAGYGIQYEGVAELEVTTLSPDLATILVQAGQEQMPIRFGSQWCTLGPPRSDTVCSWAQLRDLALNRNSPKQWAVQFLTPTSFRRDRRHSTPWPDPFSIMRSGRSRWSDLAPAEIRDLWPNEAGARALIVTDVDGLSSFKFVLAPGEPDKKTVSAITGSVNYLCIDRDMRGRWHMAWRFMQLVGLGTATAWGMGRIEVFDSWLIASPEDGEEAASAMFNDELPDLPHGDAF